MVLPFIKTSIVIGALALAGCSQKTQVNYLVTVEVDDNGVSRTGAGVWSVEMQDGGFPNQFTSQFVGETIPVDLGKKGTLFVLIAGRNENGQVLGGGGLGIYGRHLFGDIARRNRGEPEKHLDPLAETKDLATMIGKSAALDCANPPTRYTYCPFMVRFADERNPESVEAVDPNDLAATFGKGVRLNPIKVTITKAPVTVGIDKRLHWLGKFPEPRLDRAYNGPTARTLSQQLSHGDFRRD